MSNVTNYEVLCASPLGVDLGKGDCAALAEVLSTRKLEADEVLIQENSTDDSLHVIISGRLAATCNTAE
jgi:CRP-like cAMP-binding protein